MRSVIATAAFVFGVLTLPALAASPAAPGPPPVPVPRLTAAAGGASVRSRPVSFGMANAPTAQALRMFFRVAGVQGTVDAAVTGHVGAAGHDLPVGDALRVILAGADHPLRCSVAGGVYHVFPAPAGPPSAPTR